MRHQPRTAGIKRFKKPNAARRAAVTARSSTQTFSTIRTWSASVSTLDEPAGSYKAPQSLALEEALEAANVDLRLPETENPPEAVDPLKQEILEGVKRWFYHDWRRIENKLRTSIVEGISVFLSLVRRQPDGQAHVLPAERVLRPQAQR